MVGRRGGLHQHQRRPNFSKLKSRQMEGLIKKHDSVKRSEFLPHRDILPGYSSIVRSSRKGQMFHTVESSVRVSTPHNIRLHGGFNPFCPSLRREQQKHQQTTRLVRVYSLLLYRIETKTLCPKYRLETQKLRFSLELG